MGVSWPEWITGCCIIWRSAFTVDTWEAKAIWLAAAGSLPTAARWVGTPLSLATAFIFRPLVVAAGIAMKIGAKRSWAERKAQPTGAKLTRWAPLATIGQ